MYFYCQKINLERHKNLEMDKISKYTEKLIGSQNSEIGLSKLVLSCSTCINKHLKL